MTNVLFVCTANVCRSPMAAEMLRVLTENWQQRPAVSSAGTRALADHPAAEHAQTAMRELGLDISGHRSRHIEESLIQQADLVLTMNPRHKEELLAQFAGSDAQIRVLGEYTTDDHKAYIADPYGKSLASHRSSARELMYHLERAAELMKST